MRFELNERGIERDIVLELVREEVRKGELLGAWVYGLGECRLL